MIAPRVPDIPLQSTSPLRLLIVRGLNFGFEACHLVECRLATWPARTRSIVCASCNMFGSEEVVEAGSAPMIGKFFLAQFAHNCAFIQVSTWSFFRTKISAHQTQQRLLNGFHFSCCVLCISIMGLPGPCATSNVLCCVEC